MRVLFLLPVLPVTAIGGYGIVYEYANRLRSHNFDVTVAHNSRVTPKAVAQYGSLRSRASNVKALASRRLGLKPLPSWYAVRPDVEMVFSRDFSPRRLPRDVDAVVATSWQTAKAATEIARATGAQAYYFIQHYEVWDGPKAAVDSTWRLDIPKGVIATWLVRKGLELGVAQRELTHLPNAIDSNVFCRKVAWEDRRPRVAAMYHPNAWKGGDILADALAEARSLNPAITAAVFGVSRRPTELPDWCDYFQSPSIETLADEIYNQARYYLCVSRAEGWHLPPAEAMASGCCVVSTDIDGVRDYAVNGSTAVLVPEVSAAALGRRLGAVSQDDSFARAIADRGHRGIQQFGWDSAVDRFIDWLSEGRARPEQSQDQ